VTDPSSLPAMIPRSEVHRRLLLIFPEGTPARNFCTREMAAAVVFTFLYMGAVERRHAYGGPKAVFRMSDDQAARTSNEERLLYANDVVQPGSTPRGQQWYADNTREPIRDETLRQGLIRLGAVVERSGVSTTSPKPRYALADDFAALFDPTLTENALGSAIETWRLAHLTPAALARVRIVKSGQAGQGDRVLVKLPARSSRRRSSRSLHACF
jgi:hypothetical protein